ncbi:hypothetical protein [Streptosporangium roseum]|uniref:hypothetical protein n=1 Tax=Streptosporangium roseum TaxID=2001 RepID=UPI0012DCFE88|nr:hypothetical protein [Streptosporangium roseum]
MPVPAVFRPSVRAVADVPPEQARGLVPIIRHGIGTRLGERLTPRIGTAARR